jgi:CRP/FNR family transcriptional regulator
MLEEAAKHEPELALSLYRAVSLELSAARDLLIAIGQRSAIERVATFLLMLHRRLNRGDSSGANMLIDLPMRRADIADLLGLTIETVSRTITKLRTMGVIKVAHASAISITDLDRLEELAAGE